MILRLRIAAFGALLWFLGCATHPVPMEGRPGTTVFIPLAAAMLNAQDLAYGSEVTKDVDDYDYQRGELFFYLKDTVEQEYQLITRYVTTAFPDPASNAAIFNRMGTDNAPESPQVFAIVDLPVGLPNVSVPTSFELLVRKSQRIVPDGGAPGGPEADPGPESPFFLTPSPPTELGDFTLLPGGPGTRTPDTGMFGGLPIDLWTDLRELVPNPQVVVLLGAHPTGPTAALELVVEYEASVLTPLSPISRSLNQSRSMVLCPDCPNPAAPGSCPAAPETQSVRVILISPDEEVEELGIPFVLCDPRNKGRASTSDFSISSADYFDEDGNELTRGPPVIGGIL